MTLQRSAVGFLLVRGARDVLLVRKLRPKWQAGRLNGFGGKIEPGESPLACMERECFEETWLRGLSWREIVVLGGPDFTCHFFDARLAEYPAVPVRNDAGELLIWCATDALPDGVLPNLRWLINMVRDPDLEFPVHVRDRKHQEQHG